MSIAYSIEAEVQHGAMDYTTPPCNLDDVRMYRLGRVQQELIKRDLAGIILFDQLNTRYASDSTNMQIWCSHNEARYVYVPAEGPLTLFDYGGKDIFMQGITNRWGSTPCKKFFLHGSWSGILNQSKGMGTRYRFGYSPTLGRQ